MAKRTPGSREADAWLSDAQLARCAPADEAEPFRGPVPTRMVSNGEYMPVPQTEQQQRVEGRTKELADSAAKKLGVSRRQFLVGTGGMAAAFLAMNEVFGRFFNVSPVEMFEPAAYAATGAPANLFVFDDQLHFVRGTRGGLAVALRAIAQGPTITASVPTIAANPFNVPPNATGVDEHGGAWTPWNPALVGLPWTPATFGLVQYIKDIYLDGRVTVGLLSNVTAFAPVGIGGEPMPLHSVEEARPHEILTAEQTVAARDFINQIAGSTRAMAHGLLYVGKGNLDYIQYQIDVHKPDSWKGYNISNAAKVDLDPTSPMVQWRHDDEDVAYPTFEVISRHAARLKKERPGLNTINVHKGLSPVPVGSSHAAWDTAEHGHPADMPKACRDWPNLNFVTYHSCIQPSFWDLQSLQEIRAGESGVAPLREGVPDIRWTTEFALLTREFKNSYAEIGTTWASSVVTFPTVAAHILGQLLKFKGHNQIVFGSDSVWYGNPQWQIEALWRFEIPEGMRERWGYPELTETAKRKILGLNSARIYGLAPGPVTERRGGDGDRGRGRGGYHPVPANYEALIPASLKELLEFPGFAQDNLAKIKTAYLETGAQPTNTRYGWIRTRA
jgi:predicted TIM-barrel fold metal-dependent hydrolase